MIYPLPIKVHYQTCILNGNGYRYHAFYFTYKVASEQHHIKIINILD